MIGFTLPAMAFGGTGYLVGRVGHVLGSEIYFKCGRVNFSVVPHHWVPGVAAIGYGAAAAMPLLIFAGAGLVISDWDDLMAGRVFGASPADQLPHHLRTFWGLD